MLSSFFALICWGQGVEGSSNIPPIVFFGGNGNTVLAVDSKLQVWQIKPLSMKVSSSLPADIPGPFRFAYGSGSIYAVSKATGQILVWNKGSRSWRKFKALNHFVSRILINDYFLFTVGMNKDVKVLEAISISNGAIARRQILGLPIVSAKSVAFLNSKGTVESSHGSKFQPKVLIPKYPTKNYVELPLIFPEIGAFDSLSALLTKQLTSQRIFSNGKADDLGSRAFRFARSGDQSKEIGGVWWFISQKQGKSYFSVLGGSDFSVLPVDSLPAGRWIDQRFFSTEEGDIVYLWWDCYEKPKRMHSHLLRMRRGNVALIRKKVFAYEPVSNFAVTISGGRIWLYDDGVKSVSY